MTTFLLGIMLGFVVGYGLGLFIDKIDKIDKGIKNGRR
jgi:NhaP-type Na+/H+ or K+/H+ antiporter